MESVEPLKRVYELCDDSFSQGTFNLQVEIQHKVTCPTVGPTPEPETAIAKNLGTSSEPLDDNAQTSPPKRSCFYSVY